MEDDSNSLWYEERFTESLRYMCRVDTYIFSHKSRWQKIEILHTKVWGKVLFLDGKIQSAQIDEFIFHEALVHTPMFVHPAPHKVLVIGGGEGADLREILRHNTVDKVVMVDIDGELVDACKKYLPEWSCGAFDDPRVELHIDDGRDWLTRCEDKFDIVIIDLTEPLEGGPSLKLFTREFYELVKSSLTPEGVISVQSGSAAPSHCRFFSSVYKTLRAVFPIVSPYWAYIYTFQMPWGFNLATLTLDPLVDTTTLERRQTERQVTGLRYYSPHLHRAMFTLPVYLQKALTEDGYVIEDNTPYVWEA
ncbi:polyamine aminopropyltransferase [candidate division WOR-3 bacterium]|nr:polyamine aminopropyltransferase [candidate division WOR-3 bacterium]